MADTLTGTARAAHWLTMLGAVCAPSRSGQEAGELRSIMAPMLADRFPDWAFCARSMEHVARQHTFFPSYAEVCTSLAAWCRDNAHLSPAAALPPPPPEAPHPKPAARTPDEIAHVQAVLAQFRRDMATKRIPEAQRAPIRPSHPSRDVLNAIYRAQHASGPGMDGAE